MKRPAAGLALVFLFLLLTRLCHSRIIWVEEAYPAAGALQMLAGKVIYRDFWFDKPPLTPVLYLFWEGKMGIPLRIAGVLFLFACCAIVFRFAQHFFSAREGIVAAVLLAFFVSFEVPSAAMALAPDLVMLLPHLAAMYLAWKGRAFAAGLVAGAAIWVNPKAVFVLAACMLWRRRDWLALAAGFALANAVGLAALLAVGALPQYIEQVWTWGAIYSHNTFLEHPFWEGLRRTAAWAGFHAALLVAAAWYWWHERSADAKRFAAWAALALVGVALGWRFFPRYYFLLLPALLLPAARGWTIAPRSLRIASVLLLMIPFIRFGPRYALLASDLVRGRESAWADTALYRDTRAAAQLMERSRTPTDTLMVWGYRPDLFMYTRLPAGTPYLDSQPLTGVIADRHLTSAEVSAPAIAARERQRLTRYHPTFVVDGLGLFNARLSLTNYPDLAAWLAQYDEIGRTSGSVVYRAKP